MANGQISAALRHLHQLAGGEAGDAELLERFAARRDEAAFAALVRRHGPMVLAACRRVLGNHADAEDAFQATFLVLVRKAGSIKRRAALAGWLHEVALRVALRARERACTRRLHEQRVPDMPRKDFLSTVVWRDLQPVLDEEVQGLPDACREAFVLCYLEGKTYEQAAAQLRCRPGTISRRLARARELLRVRLTRRGLVLPAGVLAAALSQQAAPAAVPAALIASTVKTALRAAAGSIPARLAALAEGGLQAMTASKTKVALALLLAAGLLCASAAALAHSAPAAADPGQAPGAAPQASTAGTKAQAPPSNAKGRKPSADPAKERLIVSGQVVSADGKPVAGAAVALVGRVKRAARAERHSGTVNKTLASIRTDREGKFRLDATGVSPAAYWQAILVARASGHGSNQLYLPLRPDSVTTKLELPGERVLRGRLVDLQGQPAAGVTVRLTGAHGKMRADKFITLYQQHSPAEEGYWPRPAVSDASGHFRLEGLPAGCDFTLDVQSEGTAFARQSLEVASKDAPPDKEVTLALAPGRVLEGTVTYRDTGKPVPNARLSIETMRQAYSGPRWEMDARTDAQGRFRVVPHDGGFFMITASPPAGEPYLINRKEVRWPRGIVLKQEVKLSLRRGVRVQGVVKEAASGKPVAGASIDLEQRYSNNPFYRNGDQVQGFDRTGADGAFTIIVPPGPSHLLINAPTPDYLHASILTRDMNGPDVQPNRRYYPDGLVALDLKPDTETHRVEVTLRRGVPLKGRILGPDGKAVARASLVCRCYVPTGYALWSVGGLPVKDGRFELPGWDPANPDPVYFFSPELGLGGVLRVEKGQGEKELTVRLQKCGGAKIRIVDPRGKPLADTRVTVMLPISPGVSFFDPNGFGGPDATADEAFMGTFDSKNFRNLRTDADGRVELRGLIPGARHWIVVDRPTGGMIRVPVHLDAVSGKTLDLKDVTVKLVD
jgi:RNA polymerase sigma factor (sigma-70 family)